MRKFYVTCVNYGEHLARSVCSVDSGSYNKNAKLMSAIACCGRDYDPSGPSKLIRSMTIAPCTQDVVPVGALQNDRSFTMLSRLFLAVLEVDNGDKEDVRVLAGKMLLMSVLRRTSPPGLVIYGRPPIAKGNFVTLTEWHSSCRCGSSRHDPPVLRPSPLSARDHPTRRLAVFPVRAELSRC